VIVDLHGVVVKNPDGFPPGDLLRVERLHFNFYLSQLLRGHFSLRRLVAFSPEAALFKNEKGEWNMSATLRDYLFQESPLQLKYRMDELRLESGHCTFNKNPVFTVEKIEVILKNLSSDPKTRTEAKGNWIHSGNRFQAEGSVFLQETPSRVDVHLSSEDLVLSAFKKYLEPYFIEIEKIRWGLEVSLQGSQENGFQIRSRLQQAKGPGLFPGLPAIRNIQFQADATYQPASDILEARWAEPSEMETLEMTDRTQQVVFEVMGLTKKEGIYYGGGSH
jgi:hypothetical protein